MHIDEAYRRGLQDGIWTPELLRAEGFSSATACLAHEGAISHRMQHQ